MIEEFTWKAVDLLGKMEQLREHLICPELPDNFTGAKMMLEDHNHLRKRVVRAPVEALEAEGQRILERICHASGHNRNTGEFGLMSCSEE